MELKSITLLTEREYIKYKSVIPETNWWWWLRSPSPGCGSYVHVIDDDGTLFDYDCNDYCGGVRPFCIFDIESDNPLFWCKSEVLVGSKIKYGKYEWTVLNAENGELHALCDGIIAKHRFDEETNIWQDSELKVWLETEGLKLITA